MKLYLFLIVIVLLSFAGAAVAQDGTVPGAFQPDLSIVAPTGDTTWSVPLAPIFQAAAAKYKVPLPILLALGYFGSAYENRGSTPTIESGYGVMALRKKDAGYGMGANSLTLASTLTGVSEDTLKTDPTANINGAAAVLDYYAKMWQIDRTKGVDAWLDVVITYAALDKADPSDPNASPVFSRFFAMEIYEKLKNGIDSVNTSGERVSLPSQDIGSVNLQSLEPQGYGVSAGYAGAIWYPAGSCNYTASYCSKNTFVCHLTEGSASGTLSWFRNCSAQVSAHYVVSESGSVWQCVDENYKAWHVGCANSYCIGVEHEGYTASSSHPAALYNASALLCRDVCNRWGIPKQHKTCPPGILGHIDINNCVCGGSHTDPGAGWDWNYYIQQVGGTPPPPSYAASYNAQSYPATMTAGSTATAWVEYKNNGTATWAHGGTNLGTSSPQDRSSPFYNSGNWISANRPTDVDQSAVSTGQIGRFTFILQAPATPGTYTEKYKLVQEGVTWFGDEITWTITVTASQGNITGTVRDSYSNNPVSGATVAISGGPTTTTNSAGAYTFTNLDPASYSINVTASGYTSTSGTATVTTGNTTTKDFAMTSTDHTAPTIPGSLSATSISPSQINLAWSASTDSGGAGLAGYIIYRGGVEVGRTTAVTYSDNGLAPNTAYTYTVKAYDNAGNTSAASSPASATTQPGTVPIFQDGFADTSYWVPLKESAMPDFYPPTLVGDHDHSQFTGTNSLMTRNSSDGNQGCLIGHVFTPAFGAAKYETYFFDGTGIGYLGDFEDTTEGWSSYPNAYVTLATATGGVSGKCLSAQDGGWTGGIYKEFTSGFAVGDAFTLNLSCKVPSPAAWGTAPYVFVRCIDSGGATIGTDVTAAINADNNWHAYTLTGTVPANTAKVWIGQYQYLNATSTYNYYVDNVSFATSASLHNSSRQGLQVRCHDTSGGVRAIYYLGTYSASPGDYDHYSAGYYPGSGGWTWPGAACASRSVGWHKFTIDVQPYAGTGNEVKFLIDGTQVATAARNTDAVTYGIDMVAYGYHYRVNYPGWFDDCAMYASAPVAPLMLTPTALSDTAIRWNIQDNSNNEAGFKVQNTAQVTVASAGANLYVANPLYADETGLTANTAYTRFAKAFNGTLDSSPSNSVTRWTLAKSPTLANVTCDKPTGYSGSNGFTFTAVGGFGAGTLAYYKYAWDTASTHTFTGAENTWNSGGLILSAPSAGSYYLHVKAFNGEDAPGGTLDLGPYTYADTPPTNPTNAVETHGMADGAWQSTVTAPSFTWTGATDSGSGIAGYLVYFGTDETGTSTTFAATASYTSPDVTTGTYYLRLRAQDNAGNLANEWSTLFTFKYDSSAPDTPTVTDDGQYSASKSKLHASWASTDADSGIAEYQYAVGTSAGAIDTVGWTSAGTAADAVIAIPDPGMQSGSTYYVSVKARNGAGIWSGVASSDGIQLAPTFDTIGAAKAQTDTTVVGLTGKIVTAIFASGFYMEEPNRSSGIFVMGNAPAAGAIVSVGGTMGVNGVGERAILDPVVTPESDPDPARIPGALFIKGSSLGGTLFKSYTAGADGKMGLNNVGLLVKVAGTVIEEQQTYFTLTDGSPDRIKVITADLDGLGLNPGDHITVTGISSLELDTILKPAIRLIKAEDVTKL